MSNWEVIPKECRQSQNWQSQVKAKPTVHGGVHGRHAHTQACSMSRSYGGWGWRWPREIRLLGDFSCRLICKAKASERDIEKVWVRAVKLGRGLSRFRELLKQAKRIVGS